MNRQFLHITVTPVQLSSTSLTFPFILKVLHQQARHPHHHN